jgi:hypothetical protein
MTDKQPSGLTLEAMLLELQRRCTSVSLSVTGSRWRATIWVLGANGFHNARDYHGSTPLAAVVQAYRAVVNESDNGKEER